MLKTIKKTLTEDQKYAYSKIMEAVSNECGGILFLDAPGGTGKTFLLNLVLAEIRSRNEMAVAVASSGIAATLLEGGRTAHSALKLPLNYYQNETPTCNIGKTSGMAKILKDCKVILWDECTMAHKKSLEALDRTLRDLRKIEKPMGQAVVLLSGDFRQTLPVIPRSTAADELNTCLKASYLWKYVVKYQLSTNMRVYLQKDKSAQKFSSQLLTIGDGQLQTHFQNNISFELDFCQMQPSIQDVIQKVFPNISQNIKNYDWLFERGILAPTNEHVDKINHKIQLPGEIIKYTSIDTVTNEDEAVNFPTEFLNTLEPAGMPHHILNLKVGSPIENEIWLHKSWITKKLIYLCTK